ncbi:G patch domain-containing protein 1 [Nannizzia gypsea CBS 118893]|uniref:G patch domain-containing protein 1 n=1 Tax=Arthroderma gypseum (strain ATCC MYA-4604 / CBS 118893) TaxID=535722 RepID=E4UTH2_ARTGP|nr:G patch domain-containing protein 1 [Nannizzia gypsea CBS 118893]EFR01517.1 G patch domain-containing protein 1 [Nannizzia gypsea CBS 118893]
MAYKRSRAAYEDDLPGSPFVFYGTPLPPDDRDARDDGSYVPLWKQEVRDERGRKRLHGAFTGGFSAGYFNTVGSKEGWTPSTFVSSRKNRAKDSKDQQQRPEDFMDEEDLREAEEARQLQTSTKFDGIGSTATDAAIRETGLVDLFSSSGETVGVRLLKKMGWKEGQGIGPKVRRRANLDDHHDEDDGQTYLFAPENTPLISFVDKHDRKGIGFAGEQRLDETLAIMPSSKPFIHEKKTQKGKPRRLGGFGVGVLNDTGSDDEDPYEIGPNISYNRTIESSKKSSKAKKGADVSRPAIRSSNPLLDTKPVFISKKAGGTAKDKDRSGFRKCHDGRLPLDGFILSVQIDLTPRNKRYDPPKVPEGWVSAKKTTTTASPAQQVSLAEAVRASTLDPKARAALLGETQLPGKSVFDYMTPEAREKIALATGRTDLPPALGEKAPQGFEASESQKRKDIWNLIPSLDKDAAVQALSRGANGWMPYAEDESKRNRYRSFLEVRAGIVTDRLPDRLPGSSTDEWITELREFARAAEVFKPISGLMASRFTSSTSTSTANNSNSNHTPLLTRREAKPEDPTESAAKLGMYGPMTRLLRPFAPARLLCKRFNVRVPTGSKHDGGVAGLSDFAALEAQAELPPPLVSKETMYQLMMESGRNIIPSSAAAAGPGPGPRPGSGSCPVMPAEQPPAQPAVVDPERNEALEGERPGEAVFKAIFGSDDEDEDE